MKTESKFACAVLALSLAAATSAQAAIVVNEFDYDQPGTDSDEFIELYNPDSSAQSLSGFTLILFNGSNNSVYGTIPLTGSIPAGGYFTIGNQTSPTQVLTPATNAIQNGAPDAFGIYSGTAPTTLTTTNLVPGTGIVYEGQGTFPTEFQLVGLTEADGDSGAVAASFSRIINGTGPFVLTGTVTPGAANVLSVIPEPASLALLGMGSVLLRRRRA